MRKPWDEYWIEIAKVVSTRSTCLHRHFGCVIVKDKRIISTGYNGSAPGKPHCIDVGCARVPYVSGQGYEKCRAIHAEANALLYAGERAKNATAYIVGEHYTPNVGWEPTYSEPCVFCKGLLAGAGIHMVIYIEEDGQIVRVIQ